MYVPLMDVYVRMFQMILLIQKRIFSFRAKRLARANELVTVYVVCILLASSSTIYCMHTVCILRMQTSYSMDSIKKFQKRNAFLYY